MSSTINKPFYACSTKSYFLEKVIIKGRKFIYIYIFLGWLLLQNDFKNFVKQYHEENYQAFTLLTAGFCTFDRSWNLSINLSQSSISCSAYLKRGLMSNKRLLHILSSASALGVISQCSAPSCTLQERSSSPFPFGQEKNIPASQPSYSHRQQDDERFYDS